MGMEISSRRLQEADSRMQAEREGADRPVDDRDKERFDRAMQESRERDGQGGQENGRGGSRQDALSPQALLDSLFGSRMQSMQTSAAQAAPAPGDVNALPGSPHHAGAGPAFGRGAVSGPGAGRPAVHPARLRRSGVLPDGGGGTGCLAQRFGAQWRERSRGDRPEPGGRRQ